MNWQSNMVWKRQQHYNCRCERSEAIPCEDDVSTTVTEIASGCRPRNDVKDIYDP
jgi:hypothetical protein